MDLSEEETVELREKQAESQKLEPEIRAWIAREDEADKNAGAASPDPEALELRQLTDRSNLGSILGAAVERRSTEGPEAELTTAPRSRVESSPPRHAEVAPGRIKSS